MTVEVLKPRRLTLADKRQIIELRAQGHSLRNIADLTGRSVTAINRTLASSKAELQTLSEKIASAASESLTEAISPEWLADRATSHKQRLVTLTEALYGRISDALQEPDPVRYSMQARANAATAAALQSLTKTTGFLLPMQQAEEQSDELPELVVKIMDSNDVAAMRQQQEQEAALLSGNLTYDTPYDTDDIITED